MRRFILVACVLPALGCGESFSPESVVTNLRVLGVKAEPAELKPGEAAVLSALVVDPTRDVSDRTLLWLSCDPDPFGLGRSACSDIAQLQDLSSLLTTDGSVSLPPGMRAAGFGDVGFYKVPAELLAPLASDDSRRLTGTVAQILLLAVAEAISPLSSEEDRAALFQRIQNKQVPFIATLFRLRVSEDTQRNANPRIEQVRVNGAPRPAVGRWLRVPSSSEFVVDTTVNADAYELYDLLTPEGTESRREAVAASYYVTSGRMTRERVSLETGTPTRHQPPGVENKDPMPEDRTGRLWSIARDTRGGQAWADVPLYYCEESLPVPGLASIPNPAPASNTRLSLSGSNLGSVLEVLAGETLMETPRFFPDTDTLQVTVPVLPPGSHVLTLRTRLCTDVVTNLAITAP